MNANADGWDSPEFSELRQVWRKIENGIRKSPNPGNPLEKLIEAGANREMLLTLLGLAVPSRNQSWQKTIRDKQSALRSLAAKLGAVAGLAERLTADPLCNGAHWMERSGLQPELWTRRPLVITSELGSMRLCAKYARYNADVLGALLTIQKRTLNLRRIGILAMYVHRTTGRFFDNALADLLTAMYAADGIEKTFDAELIKKTRQRFARLLARDGDNLPPEK